MDQWISIVVIFVAAFVFGVLAHRSPKRDWEFIKTVPAIALFVISGALSQMEYAKAQRDKLFSGYEWQLKCEWKTNDLGMPERECEPIYQQDQRVTEPPPLQSFIDWLVNSLISMFLDVPPEVIGVWLGIMVARKLDRRRQVT